MTGPISRINSLVGDMTEAARLVQMGRSDQATDLIRQRLNSGVDGVEQPSRSFDHKTESGHRSGTGVDDQLLTKLPEKMRGLVEGLARGVRDGIAPVLKGIVQPRGFDASFPGRAPQPASPIVGGQSEEITYRGPGGERSCRIFAPSRPSVPATLLVMLHGCTQSADDFAAGTGMNLLAEEEGFYVAYPIQTARANAQRCWNWFEPGDQERGGGEAEIVAGLTRAALERYPIDRMRVYIAGFSAGGAAAANIAQAYPDLYAAVGIHSGLAAGCARDLSSALSAMRSGAPGRDTASSKPLIPTIVIHGDGDLTVNARNGRQILDQAGTDRLTADTDTVAHGGRNGTRTRYLDENGRVVVESIFVNGLGHAWSGGRPDGSYTDGSGPDASRAMVDFFKRHSLADGRA